MALLFGSSLSSLFFTSRVTAQPLLGSRLCHNSSTLHLKSYATGKIEAPRILNHRGVLIVKATSDVDGTAPSESKEERVSVENLPLESKVQLQLEQKVRMKLAKKIRLRRKRLVRKRHLRKKGRWPPSKLKKNKNV